MNNHLQIALVFTCFIFSSRGADLRCYQCEVRDNALCNDTFLNDCPTDQAYDSCMTTVRKTASGEEWIMKKCVLGPCALRDDLSNDELGLDTCDRSKAEYDCIVCCKGSGCNVNQSIANQSSIIWTFIIAVIATFAVCFV